MKNEKIVNSLNKNKPSELAKKRMLNEIWHKHTQHKKPSLYRRSLAMAATAAVLVIGFVFGSMWINPQSNNTFTFVVFAAELQADGTIEMRMLKHTHQSGAWLGHFDGRYLYIGVILDVAGENIADVNFSIRNGFFAKQYIELGEERHKLSTFDEFGNEIIIVFGTDFELLGTEVALDNIQADDLLLFVAVPHEHGNVLVPDIEIQVYVVFDDGERQSDTIILSFDDMVGFTTLDPDFAPPTIDLNSINLEYLTPIPESVRILTLVEDTNDVWVGNEMYVWERADDLPIHVFRRHFDYSNELRYVLSRREGGESSESYVILPIVRLNDNGDLVGTEYIVPNEIARELGFE